MFGCIYETQEAEYPEESAFYFLTVTLHHHKAGQAYKPKEITAIITSTPTTAGVAKSAAQARALDRHIRHHDGGGHAAAQP